MTDGDERSDRSGSVLGDRYELGEMIGRGGMSTVYRSFDRRMGRTVAVKVFRPGVELLDADERYRREVMLLSSLRHPGLVTVLDADLGEDGPSSTAYLVTELIDGPTLSRRVREAPLTEPQVARVGATLAETLGYVHGHGIVHRDVKPANILLAPSIEDELGTPKLVDFGIALAAESTRLTSADVTLGTANYLSPEQLHTDPLTPASDIYSLGLVLIEALTGRVAYPGSGVQAAMARLSGAPEIPSTQHPALEALLGEMTTLDASTRPDAEEVAARLAPLAALELGPPDAVATVHLAAEPSEPGPPGFVPPVRPLADGADDFDYDLPPEHQRRFRVVAAAALAVAAALIGIAAIVSFTGHKPGRPDHGPGQAASSTNAPTHRPSPAVAPRTSSAPATATGPVEAPPPTTTAAQTSAPATTSSAPPTGPSTRTSATSSAPPPSTSIPPSTPPPPTTTPPSTPISTPPTTPISTPPTTPAQ